MKIWSSHPDGQSHVHGDNLGLDKLWVPTPLRFQILYFISKRPPEIKLGEEMSASPSLVSSEQTPLGHLSLLETTSFPK